MPSVRRTKPPSKEGGGNQFFGKIPGVFGYTANCLLSIHESYTNTHLVPYKAGGKWESRTVPADPANVLTMQYITGAGKTLTEEGRAIRWGASTSNGIDTSIRDVGAEWVKTRLVSYEAVSATMRLETANRSTGPAMVAIDHIWTSAKASCRFGMTPVALDLARITTCIKQVSMTSEDQRAGTITVRSTETCMAAVVSVTCKVQPSVLSLKEGGESTLTYSCPTRAGEVCVGTKCFGVGTDRFWINWGPHYARSWSKYASSVASLKDTPFSEVFGKLSEGLKGFTEVLVRVFGLDGMVMKLAATAVCYVIATKSRRIGVTLTALVVGFLILSSMLGGVLGESDTSGGAKKKGSQGQGEEGVFLTKADFSAWRSEMEERYSQNEDQVGVVKNYEWENRYGARLNPVRYWSHWDRYERIDYTNFEAGIHWLVASVPNSDTYDVAMEILEGQSRKAL